MNTAYDFLSHLGEDRKKVFDVIQKQGPVDKNRILRLTGLKLSTLNRIMKLLLENGFIGETGTGESSGGRRPALYDADTGKAFIAGIDLSRTYTSIIITNLKMEILTRLRFAMDESCTPQITLDRIASAIDGAFHELRIDRSRLAGVGIGTVGPMDRAAGILLNPSGFFAPGWREVPLSTLLSERLRCPVVLDNGANTAVLSEFLFGDGRKFRNMAYFNVGVGIRTGAIASCTLIRTINDSEDAFGHMTINVDGEPCDCGNYGCMECYASIGSIVRDFTTSLKLGRTSSIKKAAEEIDYIDILTAGDGGDELAKEVISRAAAIFGAGLANYINLLNPGLIVLSGPLVMNSGLFYNTCIEVARRKYYGSDEDNIVFSRGGHFGEDAISAGAAAMVVEQWLGGIQ